MDMIKIATNLNHISRLCKEIANEIHMVTNTPTVYEVFKNNRRVVNVLGRLNVLYESLEYLVENYRVEDLCRIQNCGQKTAKDIQNKLREFNLHLR